MSGTFRCVKCQTVDLMDLVYPWGANIDPMGKSEPLHCTVCNGKPWHNRFPRRPFDPTVDVVINPPATGGVSIILDD